jgi:hypothetical protein
LHTSRFFAVPCLKRISRELTRKAQIIFWIRVIREIRGSIFFVRLKNLPLVVARCRTLPLAQQELPWQDRIVR